MDITYHGNLVEAALWFVIAVVLARRAVKGGDAGKIYAKLAPAFLVFSVSDVIEAHTGAWWRPPWLLVMKLGCIAVFVWGFRALKRTEQNSRRSGDGP
jgi:hypothetical protein